MSSYYKTVKAIRENVSKWSIFTHLTLNPINVVYYRLRHCYGFPRKIEPEG